MRSTFTLPDMSTSMAGTLTYLYDNGQYMQSAILWTYLQLRSIGRILELLWSTKDIKCKQRRRY